VFTERINRVRALCEAQSLDAIVVTNPDNVRYLTSFRWGIHSILLVSMQQAILVARPTEYQQAVEESFGCEVVLSQHKRPEQVIAKYVSSVARVGYEPLSMSKHSYDTLRASLPDQVSLVESQDMVTEMRAVKEEWEIANIRKACVIYDQMAERVIPNLKTGMSELEMENLLEFEARRLGADGFWFPSIVVSGPRSALPHGAASSRTVAPGEFLTIDMGPMYHGYPSDATRTIAFGAVSAEMQKVYDTVYDAQLQTLQACKPGAIASHVHDVSVRVIENAGYGRYYNHGVGHGVWGPPAVAPGSDRPLLPGMVVTIEPGIYIPGWGGVRIEDSVLITEHGHEALHSYTKHLVVRD